MLVGLVVGFFCFVLPPAATRGGGYHDGDTLSCGECHVMHPGRIEYAPQALDLDVGGLDGHVGPLLREDINDLCLACHDGSARAADVLGVNQGRRPGEIRQGGYLNRLGGIGFSATGHTLDSLELAPGSRPHWSAADENGPGAGLNCINCHAPHGSGDADPSYRNLRSDAGNNAPGYGFVSTNEIPGVNDLTRDVFIRRDLRYGEADVDFNEPDPGDSAMGRFCGGCHELFHGAPGAAHIGAKSKGSSSQRFLRHPTAGVDLGLGFEARSSHVLFASRTNRVKVMSETGMWDPPGADVTPTCITCHKAHGNGNAFGLIYRSGSGALTEDGDTGGDRVEHLCAQCHGTGTSS